jgi:DUF1365 family protein
MKNSKTGILETCVYHKRHSPIIYDFSHKVFYINLNLDDVNKDFDSKIFSINKSNIFSLSLKDYSFNKIYDPRIYIEKTVESFGLDSGLIKNISLLTMPKILGYVFNPVSFWLCFNSEDNLFIVLAEVNNTFKERHGYLLYNKDLSPILNNDNIIRSKIFHVSPFCEVQGEYFFKFDIDSKKIKINIDYHVDDKKLISTSINGNRKELSDRNLIKYFFIYPLMTLKVIILIHYHALRIWLKNVKYIKKPKKPKKDIT